MRKIFIDAGANRGQSINLFIKKKPDAKEYEIHSFECTKSKHLVSKWEKEAEIARKFGCNVHLYKAAVWDQDNDNFVFYDGGNESSSLLREKYSAGKTTVKTIRLSKFIKENFSKNDYIILKIDVEGAEYSVFKDLIETGVINQINKIYGELHGPKCGVTLEQDKQVLKDLKKHDHLIYFWDASNNDSINEKFYTDEWLTKFLHRKR